MPYDIYSTSKFDRALKRLDNPIATRIQEGLTDISTEPYTKSEQLQGPLKGKRKHRVGNLRIVFAICEECRELGHDSINNCVDCDNMPDNALKVFDAGFRGAIYNR